MRFRAIEYVLPSRTVDNAEMLRRVEDASREHLSEGELRRVLRKLRFAFRSMGTEVRHGRAPGETPSGLGAEAGRRALRTAGLEPGDVDLLVYAGVGRGFLEPATANVFQDVLGLRNATGFDLLDACASWIRAVHVARCFLETGADRTVMILNAEFNGNYENYAIRSLEEFEWIFPAFTIGEAATATIVTASDEDDGYVAEFRNFGDQRDKCIIPLPNYADYLAGDGRVLEPLRFVSHGRDIMDFGLSKLVEHYGQSPAFHGSEPDIVFFHSASDGMARDGMRQCKLDPEKGFYSHGRFANTVSATLPLGMAAAQEEGRLEDGMDVLVAVASAGISTALARFRFLR